MAHNGHQDTCEHGTPIKGQLVPEGVAPKTFCEQCAKSGSPEGTSSHVRLVSQAIIKWQPRLGLNDWALHAAERWDPANDGDDAYAYRKADEREAIIAIRPSAPDYYIERLVLHELLHLVHGHLDDIAQNGKSIDVMHLYYDELELVINLIATAMTDVGYEPIDPTWRKRFEVDKPSVVIEDSGG